MLRNRRIGCSMSGISQFLANRGIHQLREWCETGYAHVQESDKRISERLAIPESIKTTCVKPSGTVSLLAGATPGIHAPESRFYIRRVRLNKNSELVEPLREAGYDLEPAATDPEGTVVVSIPVDAGEGIRTSKELSLWEQVSLAAFMQRHWADNQVSCTVTFDPETEAKDLVPVLNTFQYQLKGISFLPRLKAGAYEQMPYEEISEEEYHRMRACISRDDLDLSRLYRNEEGGEEGEGDAASFVAERAMPDNFCDTEECQLDDVVGTAAVAMFEAATAQQQHQQSEVDDDNDDDHHQGVEQKQRAHQ